MKQKLIALLADILKISIEDTLDELAMKEVETWDSLKHMELIVSIEKIFDIELTFDEIVAMQTVKGIKQVLINRGIEV